MFDRRREYGSSNRLRSRNEGKESVGERDLGKGEREGGGVRPNIYTAQINAQGGEK